MPELVAKGPAAHDTWRRAVPEGAVVRLGRGPADGWAAPWDPQISREHVELVWRAGRLHVRSLESARNPVFHHGQAETSFALEVGDYFVIGGTTFQLAPDEAELAAGSSPSPREQQSFRPGDLRRVQFRDADHRLEVLSDLPKLIGESTSEEMLSIRLVRLLLAGVPHAEAVALVRRATGGTDAAQGVEVVQWDRRRDASGRFQPSQRLIVAALDRGDSVLHVWGQSRAADPNFTVSENLDWAFCTPVPGEACAGWGLYVAGSFDPTRAVGPTPDLGPSDLKSDLRFAELVAELIGSLLQVRRLERQRTVLAQFVSPTVLNSLSPDRPERWLDPQEADVTVLFCDLRGFSKEAEHRRDDLKGLLNRVSDALGVMTHHILQHRGVIGDFHGDAAMGFWGGPIADPDGPLNACRAALAIRAHFQRAAQQGDKTLGDFQMGIGIAHGRAVAGKIGTADQVKVTVFGPVVNLASRLEGMTKQLRVPILLDEATAERARSLSRSVGRCRRIARVRPYGLETPLMVSELLPPAEQDPILTDQNLLDYESGLDLLIAGRWAESLEMLHRIPARDRAKDFLTIFIIQHNYEPPSHWDGVIPMPSK
jgi:adenylate cyclase